MFLNPQFYYRLVSNSWSPCLFLLQQILMAHATTTKDTQFYFTSCARSHFNVSAATEYHFLGTLSCFRIPSPSYSWVTSFSFLSSFKTLVRAKINYYKGTWQCPSAVKYLVISEFQKSIHGICSRGEHKDQRCTTVTVPKCLGQVKGGWLNERAPQLLDYEFLQHRNNLKGTRIFERIVKIVTTSRSFKIKPSVSVLAYACDLSTESLPINQFTVGLHCITRPWLKIKWTGLPCID